MVFPQKVQRRLFERICFWNLRAATKSLLIILTLQTSLILVSGSEASPRKTYQIGLRTFGTEPRWSLLPLNGRRTGSAR